MAIFIWPLSLPLLLALALLLSLRLPLLLLRRWLRRSVVRFYRSGFARSLFL